MLIYYVIGAYILAIVLTGIAFFSKHKAAQDSKVNAKHLARMIRKDKKRFYRAVKKDMKKMEVHNNSKV